MNAYVTDPANDLSKTSHTNGYDVTVTFQPTDLLVVREADGVYNDSSINTLRNKYSQYYYFILSLSKDHTEVLSPANTGQALYTELVNTMSFGMTKYVQLTTSALDTIPVADFMLNRTYNLSSSTDLLFVFSKEKTLGKDWIQFNLNEFGLGIGNHRFRFSKKTLDEIPPIDFNHLSGKPD